MNGLDYKFRALTSFWVHEPLVGLVCLIFKSEIATSKSLLCRDRKEGPGALIEGPSVLVERRSVLEEGSDAPEEGRGALEEGCDVLYLHK